MSDHISPTKRKKIISAINDDGMCVIDAAKTFLVSEHDVVICLLEYLHSDGPHDEIEQLRQENSQLKAIIGEMALHEERKQEADT